jgi:RNA polymerase sigma-70 factor (ECF subfamily)
MAKSDPFVISSFQGPGTFDTSGDAHPGDCVNALTDEDLMVRFQGGDADSFADLAGRYSVPLLKLAQRYLGIREDAEEVRQETLLRVFSKAGTFRPGASFRPWIYRIALNLCRDRNRRRRRLHWVSLSEDTTETRSLPEENAVQGDEAVESGENLRRVRQLLNQLPEAQRTVVVLKEFQELTFREIAEVLACPESTVKSRLYGGLSALKSLWQVQSSVPLSGAKIPDQRTQEERP